MRDRARRAIEECLTIAAMSEEQGQITRRFLTPPVSDVHRLLRTRMESMGLNVGIDALGNLRGVWNPVGAGSRRIMLGSHIDSVPNAGAFDGVLGVTMALEWVGLAQQSALPVGIEVIAFSEEEGVRFGVPFLGSRAVAGRFDPRLFDLRDSAGVSLSEAIRAFGLDPSELDGARMSEVIAGFFEVHIEQGPILEAEDLSVAAVLGIVGQTRMSLEFAGQSNHAGTTPMHLRRDAVAAAAEWITGVEKVAARTEGMVATVGRVNVEPNATNVIPALARVSLDTRHMQDAARQSAVEELTDRAHGIAERRGLEVTIQPQLNQPAVSMDERLTAYLAEAIEAQGLPPRTMPSGAGHDAMVMAARVPTAMLFLRSPGGISHHPAEAVREEDVANALHVGYRFLERTAAEIDR